MSLYQLCEQLGIDYSNSRTYLNTANPSSKRNRMKQWEALMIAESLGINIRVTIVLLPEEKAFANKYERQLIVKVDERNKRKRPFGKTKELNS